MHAQCATSIVQFLRPELYVYVLLNLLYYTSILLYLDLCNGWYKNINEKNKLIGIGPLYLQTEFEAIIYIPT